MGIWKQRIEGSWVRCTGDQKFSISNLNGSAKEKAAVAISLKHKAIDLALTGSANADQPSASPGFGNLSDIGESINGAAVTGYIYDGIGQSGTMSSYIIDYFYDSITSTKKFYAKKNYQFKTHVLNYANVCHVGPYAPAQGSSIEGNPTYTVKQRNGNVYYSSMNVFRGALGINPTWEDLHYFDVPYYKGQGVGGIGSKDTGLYNQSSAKMPSMYTLYYYSSPKSDVESGFVSYTNRLSPSSVGKKKSATQSVLQSGYGITGVEINEIGWRLQGYSFASYDNKPDLGEKSVGLTNSYSYWTSTSPPKPVRTPLKYCTMGKGWYYDDDANEYTWYDRFFDEEGLDSKNNPVGGETGLQDTNAGYRENNYIAKYVPFQKFNLSFLYENLRTDAGIKVYLSPSLPTSKPTESSKYYGELKYPSKYITAQEFAVARQSGVKFSLVTTAAQVKYPLIRSVSAGNTASYTPTGDTYAPVVEAQPPSSTPSWWFAAFFAPNTSTNTSAAANADYPIYTGSATSSVIQDYPASPILNTISVQDDSTNLKEIRVNISLRHTYLGDLIINLKVPNGNVINVKAKYSGEFFNDLRDITFTTNANIPSMQDYTRYKGVKAEWWPNTWGFKDGKGDVEDPIGLSNVPAYPLSAPWLPGSYKGPYNFNWAQLRIRPGLTFQMDKQNGQGSSDFGSSYRSNVNDLKYLSNPDGTFNGTYSLYIKDDWGSDQGMLDSWSVEFIYKKTFVPILSLTQSDPESTTNKGGAKMQYLFGLEGNQWLFIKGDALSNPKDPGYATQSATDLAELKHIRASLKNLKIDGGYHEANNKLYAVSDKVNGQNTQAPASGDSSTGFIFSAPGSGGDNTFSLIGSIANLSYNSYVGTGNINEPSKLSLSAVNSKIGNGAFKAGIWENGAWNSGWRSDETMKDFYAVDDFVNYEAGKKWRFSIFGSADSASSFSIGDKISIGNLASIDINGERRLIKSYFTIISKGVDYITVELESDFPIRRIKADSDRHRIAVTKNIWLNGGFFNGMFKGVWSGGLFQGFPFITEMKDSHWIEGRLRGGHFSVAKKMSEFKGTYISAVASAPIAGALVASVPVIKLGLSFAKPHGLAMNDQISISAGIVALGKTKVIKVESDYKIVTDISWSEYMKGATGSVYTNISTGLMQSAEIDTRNTSSTTSLQSMDSSRVFMYDTWIDVNFDSESAVNIGKPQSTIDISVSKYSYSDNNLYGYPTYDVLSSDVFFRDSFSSTIRKYRLGSKFKIYEDYIGDAGDFDEHFDATGWATRFKIYKTRTFPFFSVMNVVSTLPASDEFDSQGWVLNRISAAGSAINAERTVETQDDEGVEAGKEMKIEAIGRGGVLDIKPAPEVSKRNNGTIEKGRYTMVKFDLLSAQVPDFVFEEPAAANGGPVFDDSSKYQPIVHFNNLNIVSRKLFMQSMGKYVERKLDATYLPVYRNVNHITTSEKTKVEFFYNKRNLSMFFRGNGLAGENISTLIMDNLRLYEVDMIPFFQYFVGANINKSVSVPYQAVAPVVQYADASIISDNPIYSPDSLSLSQPSGEITVQSESAAAAAEFASKSTEMDNAGGTGMAPVEYSTSAFNPDVSGGISE